MPPKLAMDEFVAHALQYVADPCSPDVTLHLFQALEESREKGDFLWQLYTALGGGPYEAVNNQISLAVKDVLGRENMQSRQISPAESGLIKSYMRFQPTPCKELPKD